MMKERPILFSGEMVRALLAGRKTQTRRKVKLTCSGRVKEVGGSRNWHLADPEAALACPYGQPGDRLWVRETWAPVSGDNRDERNGEGNAAIYRASWDGPSLDGGWKPSIFMPRWASRITLEVTAVRVDRLWWMSSEDAIAEGIEPYARSICGTSLTAYRDYLTPTRDRGAMQSFQTLWESINGPGSWTLNQWVWVVEFKQVEDAAK